MIAASMTTNAAMVSLATRNILSVLVTSLLHFLQVTSAGGSGPGIPDMAAYTGKAFIASFGSLPVYGNPLVNVQLTSPASSTFSRLHSWFTFNSTARTISGVPLPEDVGWTLLTIKVECDQGNNLDDKDVYRCREASDQFKLIVHALSWSEFLTHRIKSTDSSVQPLLRLSSVGDVGGVESTPGEHGCSEDLVVASLVLCASINDLNAQDRFHLMVKLSEFLSIPISSIILESSPSHSIRAMAHGFQMVSAGPGSGDICSLFDNVELVWELPCSTVKHLTDFLRVFQHNVDGGRLADEISLGIVGWYIASSNSLVTKHSRRRRGAGQHTVVPTPVLTALRPTTVVVSEDEVISSSTLSSTVLHRSSSMPPASERHQDSLTRSSSLLLPAIPSSPQLSSLSSTSYALSSWSGLNTSPSMPYTEVQITVMQGLVSSTSHSATSTVHLMEDSILSPSITVHFPRLRDRSTYLYSSIVSSFLEEDLLTSKPQEETADTFGSTTSLQAVLPESEHMLSPKLPSLSLLLMDYDVRVTSQTVAIFAFPFTSPHTEPIISVSHTDGSAEQSFGAEFSNLADLSMETESSDVIKSSLGFSVEVSEEIVASIPLDGHDHNTHFEFNASEEFQSKTSAIQDTDAIGILISYLRSEPVASTLSVIAVTVVVDINVTVTPSHTLSEDGGPSVFDTLPVSDFGWRTDQILTQSIAEGDVSHTPAVEEIYTSLTAHSYFEETAVRSTEPTLHSSSGFDAEVSLWPAATLIQPSATASSASIESGVLSELTASLTTVMATSFTFATAELVEAQQSTSLSPDVTESVVVEETVASIPSLPTEDSIFTMPTEEANSRPYVLNPIKKIVSEEGRLFRFVIPHDVFFDKEDGNTSSLTLSLMSEFNQELPSNFWLYLESGDQTVLTGLPLQQDMAMNNFSILLVAKDKEGLSSADSIAVQIVDAQRKHFTHVFIMKFALDFQQFMHNRRNLPELLHRIAEYFDDSDTQFMTVLDVSKGSLVLSWTNNTLTGPVCPMNVIKNLLSRMVRSDGTVKSPFYRHVGSDTNLTEILFEPIGLCYVSPTTTPLTSTTDSALKTSQARGLIIWAHVILPVMIAVLVFVLIILIIVFCNRRRRHRQAVLNVEKEAVSNDRNPIFFPDELEVDDPSLKARKPIVLPIDPQPDTQGTTQDLSPSKTSSVQEKTSSEDPVEQECVTNDNTETGQDHERKSDQRHRKSSKKQKEQAKDGGVSASSTLTWDRPNNHYLEEEASSRSSTLNSTRSLGSEKQHPRSPPPYWQSQSDPPPYRLPPPYLTETTSQV